MALDLCRSIIKQNGNCSSLVWFALYNDLAMMVLHGVLYDRKTKAGAAGLLGMTLIHSVESFKNLVLMFGSNANTVIADTDLHSPLPLGNRYLYMTARIIILDGIIAQIVNDLIQQSAYTVNHAIVAGHF